MKFNRAFNSYFLQFFQLPMVVLFKNEDVTDFHPQELSGLPPIC